MRPTVDESVLSDGGLKVDQSGATLTITLARPDSRNSQTPATWRALSAVATSLAPDVRIVVLRGEGKSFSAGLDKRMFAEGVDGELPLSGMADLSDADFDAAIAGFQHAFTCWRDVDPIVIAAVQGHAIGAGFQLALGADLIVVANDVQFSMKETQLGLVPDLGGTHPLVAAVGYPTALEMCASGRWIGAQEAVSTGIAVSNVEVTELDEEVARLSEGFLTALPEAVIETKHLLSGALSRTRAEQCAAERQAQRRRITHLSSLMGG